MLRNTSRSTPFILLVIAALALALVGFLTGLHDLNARQQAGPAAPPAAQPVSAPQATAPADGRPYSAPLNMAQDALTLALSGEMANGGYWRWDEIVNLLGVYGTANEFQTVTVTGTTYRGVPLTYLLRYARVNAEADRLVLLTREGRKHTFALGNIDDFNGYIIAAAPNNTLTIVPPGGLALNLVPNLASLQTEVTEARRSSADSAPAAAIPANPSSLLLTGEFARGGVWTWTDLTNLLGVYGSAGTYVTVNTPQGTFNGVPVSYLIDYAQVTRDRVNLVLLYTRSGTEVQASSTLIRCATCIITRSNSGTLTLAQPGKNPEVLPELAVIHIP